MKRRSFINNSLNSGFGLLIAPPFFSSQNKIKAQAPPAVVTPIAISTWNTASANAFAGKALASGKNALDAAIEGAALE